MSLEWRFFLEDDGSGRTYLEWILDAWRWTLSVTGSAWGVAVVLGVGIGILSTLLPDRRMNRWLTRFARLWVELFRSIPLLVQIFLWYFVLPKVFPALQQVPGFILVVFALGFFTSVRIAEIIRAGIQSLSPGQRRAAIAMGFTPWQTYRYVLLPTAFRIVWPPLTSESMNLLKNSSVAFAVSIAELTMYAMQVQEETSRGIEVYLVVTALYSLSALAINRTMAWAERRMQIPGFGAAVSLGRES